MLSTIASLLLLQSGTQSITIKPSKDSGLLPFTVSVPKKWLKNGVWPAPKDAEDGMVHLCGGSNTMTLSLNKYKDATLASTVGSFAMTKKHHPDRYTPLKNGAMVMIPIGNEKGNKHAARDMISGRIYYGKGTVLFFQYSIFDHKATAADRNLVKQLALSVKPK